MPSPPACASQMLKKKVLAGGAAAELPAIAPAPKTTRLLVGVGGEAGADEARSDRAGARLVVPLMQSKAAVSIGFPVVAKVAKPVLAHKTEAGAVALNIGDGAAARPLRSIA